MNPLSCSKQITFSKTPHNLLLWALVSEVCTVVKKNQIFLQRRSSNYNQTLLDQQNDVTESYKTTCTQCSLSEYAM